jgi:hypothetical protein
MGKVQNEFLKFDDAKQIAIWSSLLGIAGDLKKDDVAKEIHKYLSTYVLAIFSIVPGVAGTIPKLRKQPRQ